MSTETDSEDRAPMLLEDQIAAIVDDDEPAPTSDGDAAGAVAGEESATEPAKTAPDAADPAADEGQDGAAEPLAADEEKPKDTKRRPWEEQRLARLTAEKKAAIKEAADLRAENEALKAGAAGEEGVKLYTQAEVDALVSSQAEQRAAAKVTGEKLDAIFDTALAAHPDFQARVESYGEAFGPDLAQRVDFFTALTKLPNGADVIYELGGDLDHMAEVLEMNPVDMGMELARLSAKLAEAAKPKPKPRTQAPEPIRPLDTTARGEMALDDDDLPMGEFAKRFDKLMAAQGGG